MRCPALLLEAYQLENCPFQHKNFITMPEKCNPNHIVILNYADHTIQSVFRLITYYCA
jgi:hypothetical protein